MNVSRPFARANLYSDDKLLGSATDAHGKSLKAALHFDDASKTPLLVKVGISGVDIDGAMRNLETELPNWDFERVQLDAAVAWERELSRIRIESESQDV